MGPGPGRKTKRGEKVMLQLTVDARSCGVTVNDETCVAIAVVALPAKAPVKVVAAT